MAKKAGRKRGLFESERKFRLLVEGVIDYAIYMLDPDGIIINWNAGAKRIKGYEADEVVGRHFQMFYSPEDREAGLPAYSLETARKTGRFEAEGWRVRKDGSKFLASIVIDALYEDNEFVGFAKITRDITERRDNQLALEQARESLFQSQKMDAIGQLTGGIAHDFNNLLTAVLGSLELARRRVADDPALIRLIDNATRGAQRGSALTQRMLAFARRQELKSEAIDIPDLVRGMTELLERSLGPAVGIETRFPLSLPPVKADANQLEMCVLNLAVNARDAMPEGGSVVLAARASKFARDDGTSPPGNYICISVADTGQGMDEKTLARAMEPFFTTKAVGKGTGLGLSMVHGFAEQSGGQFVLKSRAGLGTTAEIWLPVASKSTEPAVSVAETTAEAPARPLTVLIVDDDILVLTNLAIMLDDLGHTVIEAGSSREALAALRGHPGVDLVITDYAMPYVTGLQLAKELEAEWPDLPIILATGYADLDAEASVALPRLAKPFLQQELVHIVNDTMLRHQRRRTPP